MSPMSNLDLSFLAAAVPIVASAALVAKEWISHRTKRAEIEQRAELAKFELMRSLSRNATPAQSIEILRILLRRNRKRGP